MDITTNDYKRCSLVSVSGRVDSNTAPTFEDALRAVIEGGQRNVVLELSGVNFMSSAGLRGMVSSLKACKKGGGDLFIATPSDRVSDVLKLAGLTSLFSVYDDVTSAVADF